MAKINIVLSPKQLTNLVTALQGTPKQSKTVEALTAKFTAVEVPEDAKKVTLTISGAEAQNAVKALGTLPKQTATVTALAGKFQAGLETA
jgi:hypothetical protein